MNDMVSTASRPHNPALKFIFCCIFLIKVAEAEQPASTHSSWTPSLGVGPRRCTVSALIPSTVCEPIKPPCDFCKDKANVCRVSIETEWKDEGCEWDINFASPSFEIMRYEGKSFCIVGEHIQRTTLRNVQTVQRFSSLFQDLNNPWFNIGSNTVPAKREEINRFIVHDTPYVAHTDSKVPIQGPPVALVDSLGNQGYKNRPISNVSMQPSQTCKNPYEIEVTEIAIKGKRLRNHLHLRLYSNGDRGSGRNCATGKIKYAIIEVRDEAGFPVGTFDADIPCQNSCMCRWPPCELYNGSPSDALPCMYTPYRSVQHPGLILITYDGLTEPQRGRVEGYDEIHVTWKFSQHAAKFIEQLHFAALVVDNVEEHEYYSGRKAEWTGVRHCMSKTTCSCEGCDGSDLGKTEWSHENASPYRWVINPLHKFLKSAGKRPYGWMASYRSLHLNPSTIGSFDYFDKDLISSYDINCHVPLSNDEFFWKIMPKEMSLIPFWNTFVFANATIYSSSSTESSESAKPVGNFQITQDPMYKSAADPGSLQNIFTAGENDPTLNPKTYFEDPASPPLYYSSRRSGLDERSRNPDSQSVGNSISLSQSLSAELLETRNNPYFCSCPEPLEISPQRRHLQARSEHSTQMLFAWMVLVPFSVFIARFYKETYADVYFLRHSWWLTIHIITAATALVFMVGGIYVLELKRQTGIKWTDGMYVHIICGSLAMGLFAVQLILGPFWSNKSVKVRIVQIIMHWFVGMLELILFVISVFATGIIRWGFFPCNSVTTFSCFLLVIFIYNLGMEIFMVFKVDKLLQLYPPRAYLPPPVRRLFNGNAFWSNCRIIFLIVFCLLCGLLFFVMFLFTLSRDAYHSCWESYDENRSSYTWALIYWDDYSDN